ncbi:MAG: SUMF1/EgtB/PvdO family nonheme iron enzyme, partial [Planctomycetota bacterium]|nr:SUMF1/EgtB/PvdO family nonheme iron enzyme [Planctomycetota bacterium]
SLPSVTAYLQRLTTETSQLKLRGLGRHPRISLPIADAYVPLQATFHPSLRQKEFGRYGEPINERDLQIDLAQVFQHALKVNRRGVVLLGEPGAGKTTGARQLAWSLASATTSPATIGLPEGITPVFLKFRNLRRNLLDNPAGLCEFLFDETRCANVAEPLQNPGRDLWRQTGARILWILDGLDEMVDPPARQKVAGWLRRAIVDRANDWFFVTSRYQGYYNPGVPLEADFVEFHVRPLTSEQVEKFVRDWFRSAYSQMPTPGENSAEKAQAEAGQLLKILSLPAYQTGRIQELTTNPLLLTILCMVFDEQHDLPTGRAELYAHCVQVMLQHWRKDLYSAERDLKLTPYDAEGAQAVLARVAWWLQQEQNRNEAPLEELAAEATRGLAGVAESAGLGRDGRAFIERMRDEAGILAMGGAGDGRCGFLHRSFQEFLAADYAAREGLAKELATRADDDWWREVALLSLRRSRRYCEAFYGEMVAAGLPERNPDLADRCLNEARFFAIEPFVKILQPPEPPRGWRALLARLFSAPSEPRSPRQIAAVLRLLRSRAAIHPELLPVLNHYAGSVEQEPRDMAREILLMLGHSSPVETNSGDRSQYYDEKSGITYVRISAGEFLMGSENGYGHEKPVHRVQTSQDYWLAKHPVTNAQYERFLKAKPGVVPIPKYWDNRRFNQPEQPVVGVSWDDAVAFATWCGGRLPTEAEWEYACRAGNQGEYCFGDDKSRLGDYAWYRENSGNQPQPAGTKLPNAWGLHDMHGNVWEWCADWYGPYAAAEVTDPKGRIWGSRRVSRGGGWSISAVNCRSANRSNRSPDHRFYNLGFRLAFSSVESSE